MKRLRILKGILIYTKANQILTTYFIFVLIAAFIIFLTEPEILSYSDALWYCYAVVSTAGFGDVLVSGVIAKILSAILTIYSLIVFAIATGVVVNFYNQIIEIRQKNTLAAFADKLEHLPDMSHEELKEFSENVTKFRKEHTCSSDSF